MDKKSKEALRRYKKSRQAQSSSESSSSSDSDSGSSSSYSSSDSERRHRHSHKKSRQSGALRRSTSSSDERHKRDKRDHCQKKLEAKRNHIKRKLKEAKLKKKAAAAAAALSGHPHRALSPATQAKLKKLAERKHLRAASKERREREKEKHRAALREREREHHRAGSRSPTKITKIRIHQDVKRQKSPPRMHHQLMSREKIIIQTRTRDRTPSAERERQRHEHKMRHEDMARERERREREAAREKERAEALARCQERQRERERLAREKLRREEEEKYGKSSVTDRLLPRGSERDIPVRGYGSRERSLERAKREMDPYEQSYMRKHRGEPEYDDEPERRSHLDREELLREREYLARRRELSPGEYVGPSGSRIRGDPRDLYPEIERDHSYKRNYLDEVPPRGHPMKDWLAERDLIKREMHEHPRDYRDIEQKRIYPDERERLAGREGRERPPFVGRPGSEWKRNDWGSPRERAEWQGEESGAPTSGRGMGFVGGPKRGGGVGMAGKINPLMQQREQRPPSEPDWDTEEGQIDTPKKPEETPKRDWIEHDQRELPLNQEKPGPGVRPWAPNEWREGEEGGAGPSSSYQRGPAGPMIHHPRSDRGGRGGFRGRGGHMDHGERMPGIHGFRPHHPPALMNLPVPPPGVFHGGPMPRFPNKRSMTYTNPNILKKQQAALAAAKAAAQASAVAAATTAVAAAKAAAQSAANATTNPGILGHVSSNRPQTTDDKPEAGEIVGEIDQKEDTLSATGETNEQKEKKNSGELSEISDSDDDILNKTEKKTKIENEDSQSQSKTEKEGNDDKAEEEELMDFEEISDGELEEERAAKGVGDALGVDWSSLVAETKRVPSNQVTTAKQKWQPHRIILDVGISMRMAGEEYAKHLLNEAKEQLAEELKAEAVKAELKTEIKTEIKDEVSSLSTLDEDSLATALENDESTSDVKPKEEELEDKKEVKPLVEEMQTETFNVDTLPPLACMQVSQRKMEMERRQLITNACGLNSRALSARQDLKLRRQLCGLPARECELPRNIPQTSDKLKAMALAAFQRALQVK